MNNKNTNQSSKIAFSLIIGVIVAVFFWFSFWTGQDMSASMTHRPAYGCVDSDGGLNYYQKGVAQLTSWIYRFKKEDRCLKRDRLLEYYCSKRRVKRKIYQCPDGCLEGACIEDKGVYIELLEPNGGEVLYTGQEYLIRWEHGGDFERVGLTLMQEKVPVSGIGTVDNSGAYSWKIPNAYGGENYSIRIVNMDDYDIYDESDRYFEISGPGKLIIDTVNLPPSKIVVAGSINNFIGNIKLEAVNDSIQINSIKLNIEDGGYVFNAGISDYRDIASVAIYDGTTKLVEATIPSTNEYTFNLNAGEIVIPKGESKYLSLKVDVGTVDPVVDNAPGTNSADFKLGVKDADSIKAVGLGTNVEITGSGKVYNGGMSNLMVLRTSQPIIIVTYGLGAVTNLSNGHIPFYSFEVVSDASGDDIFLYEVELAIKKSDFNLSNVIIQDENGSIVGIVDSVSSTSDGMIYKFYFDNPDIDLGGGPEFMSIDAGNKKRFIVYGTINGAGMGHYISTNLLGGEDPYPYEEVNLNNTASVIASENSFVWSDNYRQVSHENALDSPQWYNGHLVSGLPSFPYIIPW